MAKKYSSCFNNFHLKTIQDYKTFYSRNLLISFSVCHSQSSHLSIFVQLGFSSDVSTWVTSGGLCFDSLVAKPLSRLYYDSGSDFQQSNDWQKVQFNTDLLHKRQCYLYRKLALIKMKWKLEMIIKMGYFNKRGNLINLLEEQLMKMKWKWAGSGSAGDVRKKFCTDPVSRKIGCKKAECKIIYNHQSITRLYKTFKPVINFISQKARVFFNVPR